LDLIAICASLFCSLRDFFASHEAKLRRPD
jgi:hypothetical protein